MTNVFDASVGKISRELSGLRTLMGVNGFALREMREWRSVADFLRSASSHPDPLHDSLGCLAYFCQNREAGDPVTESECEDTLEAIRKVEEAIEERTHLLRRLMGICDKMSSEHHESQKMKDYESVRRRCRELFSEGAAGSPLFVALEKISSSCAAQGHVLGNVHLASAESARTEEQVVKLPDGRIATVLVEIPMNDINVEEEVQRKRSVQELVQGIKDIGELQTLINNYGKAQGEALSQSLQSATQSLGDAMRGREQLSRAAKYRILGVTLFGAVAGAAIGGPIGLVAGAKTALTIGGATAIGGVAGGVTARVVGNASVNSVTAVDEDYALRNPAHV